MPEPISSIPPAAPRQGVLLAAVVTPTAHVVLREASAVAAAMGLDVVALHVDASRQVIARHPDGTVDSAPLDPDADDEPDRHALGVLRALVDAVGDEGFSVSLIEGAGNPAEEIALLAEHLDARMIAVGTREQGLARGLAKRLTGSVAVHLAHHQHRSVLVVPLAARGAGDSVGGREVGGREVGGR